MNTEITELIGKTITKIVGMEKDKDVVIFETSDGEKYKMYHEQDCCEEVTIDDVCGDVNDLIGSPILCAEECTNDGGSEWGTCTWTFYHFVTVKGYLVLKWYGESNGYYSESVDFCKIDNSE